MALLTCGEIDIFSRVQTWHEQMPSEVTYGFNSLLLGIEPTFYPNRYPNPASQVSACHKVFRAGVE